MIQGLLGLHFDGRLPESLPAGSELPVCLQERVLAFLLTGRFRLQERVCLFPLLCAGLDILPLGPEDIGKGYGEGRCRSGGFFRFALRRRAFFRGPRPGSSALPAGQRGPV